ncbi:MAG: H+-translocating transhydrogenase subunit beta [Actinomycetota bacterium]|nr:H+-translocating transhydrogenase subunit beta [Actinomycetota bacterium]
MSIETLQQYTYIIAAGCFILALKWLSRPSTARRGVTIGEIGMAIAILGALITKGMTYNWIIVGLVLGAIIGLPLAIFMPMKDVPQRTALSHSFGGLAAAVVGTAEFYLHARAGATPLTHFEMVALILEVLLGYLTFTGSLMAFGKLQELLPSRPMVYKGQNAVNLTLFAIAVAIGVYLVADPTKTVLFPALAGLSLLFGVLLIIPIGGADMPTVISLLNSYAGLSASAMGFVLNNPLLIVAGALDGSSGLILSIIMCKAMNRSFTNVLFGGFGQVAQAGGATEQRPYRSASAEEAASILEVASRVVVVPGYGMAVAQAQHKVRELYDSLTKAGVDVKFAIHPVAGRMPGHMNVLLAEADIPYDRLIEMDEINPEFAQTDVVVIIGANDVTNPAAKTDKTSPIYGMPILDVDKASTVMVIKRSMSPGFAGIDNDLYYMDKTMMLFGDAKAFTGELVKELAAAKAGV